MTPDEILIMVLKLGFILGLVVMNGFFVAAEFALVKVRETQLTPLAKRGMKRAKVGQKLIANLDAALSATQLGITLTSLGLGWYAEPFFVAVLDRPLNWLSVSSPEVRHSIAFAIGFSTITFLHIVVGELAPKSLAIQKPVPTTLWIAIPMEWFRRLSFPAVWLLNHASVWVLRRAGLEAVSEAERAHSEEELRLLFSASAAGDDAASLGRRIVLNAFDLRRRIVREVMRPRKELVVLNTDDPMSACLELAEKTRYSRFPVCDRGNLDAALGVIHVKDLHAMRSTAQTGADLGRAMRKLIYVPESCRLERLLGLFLERRLHMAIVVDEYGGTLGMVTLENVLEELVGQIQDEFDQEKPLLVAVGEGLWQIDGAMPVHDLEKIVGVPLASEAVITVAGLVTKRLGGFAKPGDTIPLGEFQLTVDDVDGLRVTRLRLHHQRSTQAQSQGQPEAHSDKG